MRRVVHQLPVLCALAALLAAGVCIAADAVWDAELGWIDLSTKPAETAEARYEYATGLLVSGRYAAALDMFMDVRDRFPASAEAARAALRVPELQLRLNQPRRALRTTNALLADLPKGLLREEVVALQLRIAEKVSEGRASRGATVFGSVASSAQTPKQEYAARMGQGGALFRKGLFAAAADAYKAAILAWPEAPDGKDAVYDAAICDLYECREEEGDDARLRAAHDNFIAFGVRAPDDPRTETAAEMASAVESALAEKDLKKRQVYYGLTYHIEGNYRKAEKLFRKGAKRYVGQKTGGVAHYYRGESLFERGKHKAAFAVLSGFLKGYPDSLERRKAVNILMDIAQEAMAKDKPRFTLDVLDTIITQDPTGPLADDAFMLTGRVQLDRKNYPEASAAFRAVVNEYPRSEWMYASLYNAALSELRGSAYSEDNERLLAESRSAFELYLNDQPNGVFAAEARNHLTECRKRQAGKLLEIAEFYRRQRKYKSVAVYCRLVLGEHPESAAAVDARRLLSEYGDRENITP